MIRLLAMVLCAAFIYSDSHAEIKRWRVGDEAHPWTLLPVTGRLDLGRSWAVELVADEHRSAFDDAFRCGTDTTASINLEIRVKNTASGLVLVRCFGAASPAEDGTVICDIRIRDVEDGQRVADDRRRL